MAPAASPLDPVDAAPDCDDDASLAVAVLLLVVASVPVLPACRWTML
jgi:hypothetical protein